LTVCRGFAQAGDFQSAWAAVDELTEYKWEGYALLGAALAESGDWRQARRALRLAWRQLHLNHGLKYGESYPIVSEIGQALALAGEPRAARYAAEDIGRDFEHYTGDKEQAAQLLVFVTILECAAHLPSAVHEPAGLFSDL
jgi:hypothetical protein